MSLRVLLLLPILLGLGACELSSDTEEEAGFSLVRLGPEGEPMKDGGETWSCVRDERTGLVWEVKTDRPGPRYQKNTYTWFDPDSEASPMDYRGTPDGGVCSGSECDTSSYVAAVNEMGLCGFTDWRMPHREELRSISDPRRPISPPTLDTAYFPNAEAADYWSGNDYRMQHDAAWSWGFDFSLDRVDWKREPKHVRLVRGTHSDIVRLTRDESD